MALFSYDAPPPSSLDRVCFQAAKEQEAFAEELREETDKLVMTYELALQEAHRQRDAYAQKVDTLASEAAIGKAKVEKADRLVGALKTRMTKYRIDTARAACRFIVDNVRRRKAWEDNVSALQNQVNTATAVTHKLTTMRNGIEEALQANKDEILLEVCILGAGGRLGTRPRLSPIVHLDHGLQVIPTGMRDCIPTYDCVPLASVLHCLSQHKATCAAIQAEIDGLYHDRVELRVVKEKLKAEVSVTVCVVVVGGAKGAGILSWNHHCY